MIKLLDLVMNYWMYVTGGLFITILLLKVVMSIVDKIYRSTLPKTQFGFRGKLVYSDDSPKAKVFVNHRYQLSAKPDFIFRTGLFTYTLVEYKSRSGYMKVSDIIQVKASIIAARSKFNITKSLVITGKSTKEIEAASNRSLYRDIKTLHKTAKRIKHFNKKPRRLENSDNCNNCGYREHCLSDS